MRDQLGLRRARWAYTGGAPLGPDTFRFFRSIGVNLKQVYGSTESSALISIQPDAEANPTTAGRPCPGIEVKIADRGEVLIRSRGIFKGYYKAEEATREVVDGEGWFHTGDAGFLDPRGHLVIIDRAKDVGAMVDGTPFAPQFIENKLKFSPYIREAVAFGNEKPFVAAMIAIDLNTVGNWAERRGIPYTSYMDLTQKSNTPCRLFVQLSICNLAPSGRIHIRLKLDILLNGIVLGVAGQIQAHRGALAEFRINPDLAARLSREPIDHRQPEPRPLADWLRREERIERLGDHVGCHARPRIRHADRHILADRQVMVPRRALIEPLVRGSQS